jgi:multisite-specific tRNA:(cytosine-C5)-methyltransferase
MIATMETPADVDQFGGNRGGKQGGRGQRSSQWRTDFKDVDKQNARFESYYNELGVVAPEHRQLFWDTLKRPLPNSFRFAGSKG